MEELTSHTWFFLKKMFGFAIAVAGKRWFEDKKRRFWLCLVPQSSSVVTVHVRRCLVQAEIETALAIRFAVCNVSGLIIVVIVGNA